MMFTIPICRTNIMNNSFLPIPNPCSFMVKDSLFCIWGLKKKKGFPVVVFTSKVLRNFLAYQVHF